MEVADIFRAFGPAWREANCGHVSHAQLKVMSAIESCRTAALGGYVARCENPECAHTVIGSSRVWPPPPKYRHTEAANHADYPEAD